MKPFTINRDSWHYKLNRHFFNPYEYTMEYHWEPKYSDFCSYWRATFFRVIGALILTFLILLALTGFVVLFYTHPLQAVTGIVTIVSMFSFVFLLLWSIEKMKNRTQAKPKSQSLLAQKYRAHKEKICPMVEFTQ